MNTEYREKYFKVIREAKIVAIEYYRLTGKPLGVTGEVAEFEAARILGLQLQPARQKGFDALKIEGVSAKKIQIKGRCIMKDASGQRVGRININDPWDSVILILLDCNLEPLNIFEAERDEIVKALTKPGSKARNERGTLTVSQFKNIGRHLWSKD